MKNMKLNKLYLTMLFGLLLSSCSTGSEDSEDSESNESTSESYDRYKGEDQKIEDFESVLRPNKTAWDVNEIYVDTLEFVLYNDDADYAFAIFRTKEEEEVKLALNDFVHEDNAGKLFHIEWSVDSLWEAGEGDALYFQERANTVKELNKSWEFENFLSEFTEFYAERGDAFKKTLHSEMGIITTFNPGLYCVTSSASTFEINDYSKKEFVISNEKPLGDFCEGFPKTENGFYYEFISSETDVPTFDDMSGDGEIDGIHPYWNEDFPYDQFVRVTLITEEYWDRYLYFMRSEGSWYLWIEDFCDCSA
jgi:hypothetical protein